MNERVKCVALSGDTALVGARCDDNAGGTDAGSVYGYTRSQGNFSTVGEGCPGSVGVPSLAAAPDSLPWIRGTFEIRLSGLPTSLINAPFGILGLSKTEWSDFFLPQDLSLFGLPGSTPQCWQAARCSAARVSF